MTDYPRARQLVVLGEPYAKQRPRARALGKGRATIYTPQETKDAEGVIRDAWEREHKGKPDGTGRFSLVLVFHRRKRHRRDLDNMAKLVMDALNGAPLAWEDDYQVEFLQASTRWVEKGQERTEIALYPLGTVHPATLVE